VRGAGVNVRASPSSSAEKLFALPGGRKVSVGETERGWLKITDENGRTGWLYEDYVSGS
jgi:SH3-like domain-containing protein